MEYLHHSFLESHGRLKSSNVTVDTRWTCKVTDYGARSILKGEPPREGQSQEAADAGELHLYNSNSSSWCHIAGHRQSQRQLTSMICSCFCNTLRQIHKTADAGDLQLLLQYIDSIWILNSGIDGLRKEVHLTSCSYVTVMQWLVNAGMESARAGQHELQI